MSCFWVAKTMATVMTIVVVMVMTMMAMIVMMVMIHWWKYDRKSREWNVGRLSGKAFNYFSSDVSPPRIKEHPPCWSLIFQQPKTRNNFLQKGELFNLGRQKPWHWRFQSTNNDTKVWKENLSRFEELWIPETWVSSADEMELWIFFLFLIYFLVSRATP